MKYRKFGDTGWDSSVLGFGCMRLPTRENYSDIDEPRAEELFNFAIDQGINYFDTAYPYHGGNSEVFLGKYFHNRPELNHVKIATKLPVWKLEKPDDFHRYLEEQLKKLKRNKIDFYLLHALNEDLWKKVKELNILNNMEESKKQGIIGNIGFSFHDQYPVFKQIIDEYPQWDFCQIQYNYMNEDFQAGTKGYQFAVDMSIPIIVMEPLLGGRLVNPPPSINRIWKQALTSRTPPAWALQWLWSKPGINIVLSGMSSLEQVKENILTANKSKINLLNDDDLDVIDRVRDQYLLLKPIPCNDCKYCLPCPEDVDIPRIFEVYNSGKMYEKMDIAKKFYQWIKPENNASRCVRCGQCEQKCPQNINISDLLSEIHATLCSKN